MKNESTERKETYERMARDCEHGNYFNGYHHVRRLEVVQSFLSRLGNDLLVLDAGCGDGLQMSRYVQSQRVVGMDLSFTRLKRAKERLGRAVVFTGDMFNLPFKENTFDVVILSQVIEHFEKPEIILQKLHQILKPGGHIILDTPSQSNVVDIFLRLFGIKPKWGYTVDETHLWFFTMKQLTSFLEKSGFTITRIQGAPFLRYELPILHHFTWVKSRWWLYRLFDFTLGKLPLLHRLGAIQVFMAQKVTTNQ